MFKQFPLKEIYFYWALCLAVFIFLFLRAIYVPIVHDEAATYFFYLKSGDFIPYYNWANHADANNHLLNSALAYLSVNWFGDGLLSMRLPNLLSSILLFFYVWKLAVQLKTNWIRWAFICALLTSYYFLEFFSVARGYGMSMAFLIAGLHHLIRYVQSNGLKDLLWLSSFMLLSTLANLTLVNTHLIILCIVILTLIYHRNKQLTHFASVLILMILPIFAFIKLGLAYQASGLLYYGQGASFYKVTVLSLADCFTHISPMVVVPVGAMMLLVGLIWVIPGINQNILKQWNTPAAIFWMLFWGNVVMVFLQIWLFDVNYPEDRTALYFFPLMVAMLCFTADTSKLKWHLIPLFYFPVHLIVVANIDYNYFWKSEHLPESFYHAILKDKGTSNKQPTIGGYHIHKLTWDYYNYNHNGPLTSIQHASYPDTIADFQIAEKHEKKEWDQLYNELECDPYSNLCLYKRQSPLNREMFFKNENAVWLDNVDREFINFHQSDTLDIGGKAILAEFTFDFDPARPPVDAWVVLQVLKDGEEVYYEYFSLERYREKFDKVKRTKVGLYTNKLPEGALDIRCYIWNLNKERLTIHNGQIKLYYLE